MSYLSRLVYRGRHRGRYGRPIARGGASGKGPMLLRGNLPGLISSHRRRTR